MVSLSDTIKKRERFDTLEEMEIMGQGEYGRGLNVPVISKGLDRDQSQGLSAAELGKKLAKQKLLRKELRRQYKVLNHGEGIKKQFNEFIDFARIHEDVEGEYSMKLKSQFAEQTTFEHQMEPRRTIGAASNKESLMNSFYNITRESVGTFYESPSIQKASEGVFQGLLARAQQLTGLGGETNENTPIVMQLNRTDQIVRTNEMRIQGAVHMLCLVIFGVKRYLNVALPHAIHLRKRGFTITHNSSGRVFPLYLHTVDSVNKFKSLPNPTKQSFLENALFLLDQDIQFLNYISGEKLVIGAQF